MAISFARTQRLGNGCRRCISTTPTTEKGEKGGPLRRTAPFPFLPAAPSAKVGWLSAWRVPRPGPRGCSRPRKGGAAGGGTLGARRRPNVARCDSGKLRARQQRDDDLRDPDEHRIKRPAATGRRGSPRNRRAADERQPIKIANPIMSTGWPLKSAFWASLVAPGHPRGLRLGLRRHVRLALPGAIVRPRGPSARRAPSPITGGFRGRRARGTIPRAIIAMRSTKRKMRKRIQAAIGNPKMQKIANAADAVVINLSRFCSRVIW